MAGAMTGGGRAATLNLMVGIFLKLLGFFVVLYSYTEISPIKARQAEQSLAERFNVSVSLMRDQDEKQAIVTAPIQNSGRAYRQIADSLNTQVDFLATETIAQSDILVLHVPAKMVLALNGHKPGDDRFAETLSDVLRAQNADGYVYQLRVTASAADHDEIIRELGRFAEQLTAVGYPANLVTLGFNDSKQDPAIELQIKQVRG